MATKKVQAEEPETKENEKENPNMKLYCQFASTPETAKKIIGAGRLKGYTDINPMWRIKRLTEVFGPAGFGWWTQEEKFTYEPCETGEVAVFCSLQLVVVDPDTHEQSHPISGFGGNKFVANESKGKYCNDEAMKMAYTDALAIACKALGFSHDIYYSKDRTKYTLDEDEDAANNSSSEDIEALQAVTKRIQTGIGMVTKDMTDEQKAEFTQNVIVKHIGGINYMTCRDLTKLNALLKELLALAKKTT